MTRLLRLAFFLFLLFFQLTGRAWAQSDSAALMQKECFRNIKQFNWDSALYYANVLETLSKKEDGEISERHGYALYLIGELYRSKENLQSAYAFFKNCIAVYSKLSFISNAAYYSLALTRLYYLSADVGAAEDAQMYFDQAIEVNNKSYSSSDNLQLYLSSTDKMLDKGEYARADSIYTEIQGALDTLPKTAHMNYLQASLYNNLGKLYIETGNLTKALPYLQKALKTEEIAIKQGYDDNDYVQVCLNLSEAYAFKGEMDSAWAVCRQAERALTPNRWFINNALITKTKAMLYQQQKQYDKAITYDSLFVNPLGFLPTKPDGYYATMVNLGILYINTRQHQRADSLFRQILYQQRQTGIRYSYVVQQAFAGLSANLIDLKRYSEATDTLLSLIHLTLTAMKENFTGMSEAEKLKYRTLLDSYFDLLYTCLYQNELTDPQKLTAIFEAELHRKSLVLTSQVQLLNRARQVQDTLFRQLFNSWLNNKQMLSKQYSLPVGQRFLNTDSLEQVDEALERQIALKGFRLNVESKDFLAKSLMNQKETIANIAFVRFLYAKATDTSIEYAAFVFKTGDTIPSFVPLCNEAALLKLMKDERGRRLSNEQLTQNLYEANSKSAGLLYRLIWQPLTPHIKNCSAINYSPAGLLNNMSIGAIYTGKERLMNSYSLHCFSSLLDAANAEQNTAPPLSVNLWGNINYDNANYLPDAAEMNRSAQRINSQKAGFNFLSIEQTKSGSKVPFKSFQTEELSNLKKLFAQHHINFSSVENNRATEEGFKQQAPGTRDVLHISTHGFYFPLNKKGDAQSLPGDFVPANANPLFRCGLAFSGANHYWLKGTPVSNHEDGILTGFEVAQLDLHKVRLVTLSACETGLGDVTEYEGNLGLQRAFKIAGVRYLLVSLWQVPAKQTAALLSLFYTNWLKGTSPSEALRNAQRAMGKKYTPYSWAGFVLIE